MISWQTRSLNIFLKYSIKPAQQFMSFKPFQMLMLRHTVNFLALVLPTPRFVSVNKTITNGVPGEWVKAGDKVDDEKVILYLHGGGYFFGSPRTHRPLTWRLSAKTKMKVLSIDYRMAPEHELPAPMEDAISAYKWLLKEGYKPENISFGGDSAGGNLTLVTLLECRNQRLPMPGAAFVLSPFADFTSTSESLLMNERAEVLFHHRAIRRMHQLLTKNHDPYHPQISPVYAEFDEFPPLFIHTGTTELLLDDSHRIAYQARTAGVDVTHKVWHDVPHVFTVFADFLPEAKLGIQEISEFLLDKMNR